VSVYIFCGYLLVQLIYQPCTMWGLSWYQLLWKRQQIVMYCTTMKIYSVLGSPLTDCEGDTVRNSIALCNHLPYKMHIMQVLAMGLIPNYAKAYKYRVLSVSWTFYFRFISTSCSWYCTLAEGVVSIGANWVECISFMKHKHVVL